MIGGAGGVAGDFFWSDIDLVDCTAASKTLATGSKALSIVLGTVSCFQGPHNSEDSFEALTSSQITVIIPYRAAAPLLQN